MYELQQDLTLGEGEDLYTNRVTESDCLFPSDKDSRSVPGVPVRGDLSAQDTQPENEEIPQSSVDGHEGYGIDFLHAAIRMFFIHYITF